MVDMEETETETEPVETRKDCKWCDRAWGINGLLLGAIFTYAGLDLLTGGGLTRYITRLFGNSKPDIMDEWIAQTDEGEGEDE